ncbi:MAG TPA: LuxR C-terminal-related transcriptional regulator, partial [Gemmatimonadales bacterium]|nr:LuxR C-terminal-related transcriptional regulator [Gemmatimonadales bacterium]
ALLEDDRTQRPRLSARERQVLIAYASGMTLEVAARHIGIKPGTAKTYLDRVKAKYRAIGRPAYTKLELAQRIREDGHEEP